MSRRAVVDASVAVKWVIAEDFSDQALSLLRRNAWQPVVGPQHLLSEVTNAIYQYLRRRQISTAEADVAIAQLMSFGIKLVAPADLYPRALALARTYGLKTTYELSYVVLAEILQTDLWTDDRTLLNSLGPAAPWVRWIGDYQEA